MRSDRDGGFYCLDTETGARPSLHTKDRKEAERLVRHKNEALKRNTDKPKWKKRFRVCCQCGSQESATAGTLFHGSRLELKDWFKIFWLAAIVEDGFNVGKLHGRFAADDLKIVLSGVRTEFMCVKVVRLAMTALPKFEESARFGLLALRSPKSRNSIPPKIVAAAVSGNEIRLGLLAHVSQPDVVQFLKQVVGELCDVSFGTADIHCRHSATKRLFPLIGHIKVPVKLSA